MTTRPLVPIAPAPAVCAAHPPTKASACFLCKWELVQTVQWLWQRTHADSLQRHILVPSSGDAMDTKASLEFLHFALVGSHPSLPGVQISPREMALRLNLPEHKFRYRMERAYRIGATAYLRALIKPMPTLRETVIQPPQADKEDEWKIWFSNGGFEQWIRDEVLLSEGEEAYLEALIREGGECVEQRTFEGLLKNP